MKTNLVENIPVLQTLGSYVNEKQTYVGLNY